MINRETLQLKLIRRYIVLFVVALVLSGITAFPIRAELDLLVSIQGVFPEGLHNWFVYIYKAVSEVDSKYPQLSYGTDWLAFAHIVIAVGFIGPWIDPVRNKWVIIHAMIACVMIWPLAFIAGPIRGIPFYWQLIDCSFGVIGLIPLGLCLREINKLSQYQNNSSIQQA